jgi:hypothetical protein
VSDVTIPNGATINPGVAFTKTWRLKNIGTCNWTTSYSLVFTGGDQMSGPASISLPKSVIPGQVIDLSVNLLAPAYAGTYRGTWLLRNLSGKLIGSGATFSVPLQVQVKVNKTALEGSAYDFFANACSAAWSSSAGTLPCPGRNGDRRGFVLKINQPKLEDGKIDTHPGLLTFPQNINDGYIQGSYPPFSVQPGDRFRAIVNCEAGATSCLVLFRLDFQINNGTIQSLWAIGEVQDGKSFEANLDLNRFAGQEVKFILKVLAFGPATGDRALWVAPRIVRIQPAPTPTASPSATSTPTPR